MQKYYASFGAGELSPELYYRTDILKFNSGLKTCKNFIPNIQGGLSRRTGTKYIGNTRYHNDINKKVRLISMKNSSGSFILEFGEQYLRFWKDNKLVEGQIEVNLFDPTQNYYTGDICFLDNVIDFEYSFVSKRLTFINPVGESINHAIYLLSGIPNEHLSVIIDSYNRLQICLSNTYLNENTADNIQNAIHAEGTYPNMIVVANEDYNNSLRFMTAIKVPNIINKYYRCIQNVISSNNNVSICPPTITDSQALLYWEEIAPGGIYKIDTPFLSSDLEKLEFIQSVDTLFITHPDYPTYKLFCNSENDWDFDLYDYDVPPFMSSNIDETHTMTLSGISGNSITLTSSKNFFQPGHIGSYFKIYHDIGGQSVRKNFTATGASSIIKCKGTWRFHTFFNSTSTQESDLTIDIQKSINNGATWKTIRTFTLLNSYADSYGTEDEYCLLRMNCTAYNKDMTANLTCDSFNHAGIIKIMSRTSATIAIGEVLSDYIFADTIASYDWAESAWSLYRGYPAISSFYQDRLVFANTYSQPSTIWFSRSGDYYSFDVSDDIQDNDAISVSLTARKLNSINNIIPMTNLITLSNDNSFIINSSTGVLTPTTILSNIQENCEADDLNAVIVSNRIIYISNKEIVKDISYDYNSNSYKGTDLNILSNHLFKGYQIIYMDYQKIQNNLVYMVRNDGKLIIMNYMPDQEVISFSQHETDGIIESLTVLNNENKKEVWISVLRNNGRFIEKFMEEQTENKLQWYLDSAIYKYNETAFKIIDGLEHLEGKTIDVLGDGNVFKDLVVISGEVELPVNVNYAIAGLKYISDFETLPLNLEFQNGTMQDKKSRIFSVTAIFSNSRGGFIGDSSIGTITDITNSSNLTEVYNEREYLDLSIPLFTGKKEHLIRGSWNYDKTLFIRQYDPLPMNILGIIFNFQVGG